mgnify:CR=1 FL=1|jgi:hypothetical protein
MKRKDSGKRNVEDQSKKLPVPGAEIREDSVVILCKHFPLRDRHEALLVIGEKAVSLLLN